MKKALSLFLAFILTFGIIAIGFTGNDLLHVHAEESEAIRWNNYEYTVKNGEACIVKYYDSEYRSEHQNIPDTLGGYPVTSIGVEAFAESNNVTTFVIPESVKSIGEMAFRHCENLTRVEIKGDLDLLDSSAFMVCKKLSTIILPENIKKLGAAIFYNTAYENNTARRDYQGGVYLDNYLISIDGLLDNGTFSVKEGTKGIVGTLAWEDDFLREVYIPASVQHLGANPFASHFALQKITVDENNPYLKTDEDGVLYADGGKTLVCYPAGQNGVCYVVKEGVEEIAEEAFGGYGVKNLYLPKSIKKIHAESIKNSTIYYEGNASEWENVIKVFHNDETLNEELKENLTVRYNSYSTDHHKLQKKTDNTRVCTCKKGIRITADDCDKIRAESGFLYIPDTETNGVKVIGYAHNNSTAPLVIPETLGGVNVTVIGNNAFDNCQATSITIPKYVSEIEPKAFAFIGGNVEEFIVESGNENFTPWDGVLHSVSPCLLIRCPTNSPLEKYTVTDRVMGINYYAFANTKQLKEVNISKCASITSLGYDNGIIADYAFYNSSVEKVTFEGNSVFWILSNVFEGSNLSEINLPVTVGKLGYDIFKNTSLTNNKDNYDSDGALYYDNWLIATDNEFDPESYSVKEGTVVISGGVFNRTNLKELNIAKSVKTVGANPTMYCPKFEKYTVAEGNNYLSADEFGVLYSNYRSNPLIDGSGIIAYPAAREETCYVIKSGTGRICEMAFANTKYLKNVHIPSSVNEVGAYSFGINESSMYMLHYQGSFDFFENVDVAKSEISIRSDVVNDLYIYYTHYVTDEHTVTKDVTVEPTCTEDGCVKTVCSCGYEFINTTYEATDHTWVGDWKIIEEPTCTARGLKENTCSVCNETVLKNIRMLGHDNVIVSQTEGNCIQQGETVYHCNRCGEDTVEYTKVPDGHKIGEETITIEATCISEGGKYNKCEYCQKAVGDPIEVYPATGEHISSDWIVEVAATCTTEGIEFKKCTACDSLLEKRAIAITPHSYVESTVSSNCAEITKKYTCSVCNDTYTETVSTGEEHVYVKKTEPPTCTKIGRTYFACRNCDVIEIISQKATLDHEGGDWVVTKEPSCGKMGMETQYCKVCGTKVKTRTLTALRHNYVKEIYEQHSCTYVTYVVSCTNCSDFYFEDIMSTECVNTEIVTVEPTCMEDGYTCERCVNCGKNVGDVTAVIPALVHKSTETITKEPTCLEEGTKTITCLECDMVKEIAIPKAAHTFGKWEYDSGNTFSGICSACGEGFDSLEVELSFTQSEVTLYNQTSKVLSVTVTENISDDIVFSSSDSNIVHVYSNGKITAKAPGNATITAKLAGTDITATCEITVAPRNFGIEWICDGECFEYSFVEEGGTITPPEVPVKDGIVFVGWTPEIPEVMPSQSLTFTAVYNIVSQSPDYDVSVTYSVDAFDEPISLDVKEVEGEREPGGVYMVEGQNYDQVGLYNIKAVNENSEVVQPNEGHSVTLRIPIPEAYKNRTAFVIYHRFVDGRREQLSTAKGTLRVENGYLVFEVSNFSEFEVLAVAPSIKIVREPVKTVYSFGEDIDLTGIRIIFISSDGTEKVVTKTEYLTVSGYDSSEIGTQTVKVNYGQYSDTLKVKVRYTFWQWIAKILTFGMFKF